MFFTDFLKSAAPLDDQVTLGFIERMVPRMLERYVTMSAKGGTHQDDTDLSADTIQKFEAKNDQSMCTHLLNGIFPSLRLMYLLETEDIEYFSPIERRLYIVSYMMHDIDKIDHRPVETKTREDIERSKARILHELQESRVSDFFPDVADYLEDITFLVVNTQQRWNTHLNTYLWRFRLSERRVELLRRFCTYSDQIAYLVTSPSDISHVGDLVDILMDVSRNAFTFRYHQLRDVRGLFTSVVNNGIVNLLTDNKQREGIWPYLFFSNGVVYIARKTLPLAFTTGQVVESVTAQLRNVCGNRIKQNAPGFKFDNKGIAKYPEYYFEFITLEDYLSLLADSAVLRTRSDVMEKPLRTLRQMYNEGEIDAPLPEDAAPDIRSSRLSRFFAILFTDVLGLLDASQEIQHEQDVQAIVAYLDLQPYWERSKNIRNKGGMGYRWFWLAAWYLHDHKTIDNEGDLYTLFHSTFNLVRLRIGDELREGMRRKQQYLRYLPDYLAANVELSTDTVSKNALPDFYAELEGYSNAKNTKKVKGKKLICTLCNSEYPTEAHSDDAVLFQPFVYKNKLPLYANENAGGFCTICALELMLRQLLQKGSLRLTGGKFEAMKTKYIAVYPNYFFTAETGAMVQDILLQLTNINFFTLKRELTGKQLTVHDVLNSTMFESLPQSETSQTERPLSLEDIDAMSDDNDAGLEGDEGDEASNGRDGRDTTKVSTDSGYIKYEYPEGSYPGMCLFGMRAGKDDNDSASWAMPALLALALPLATGAKVVISEMLLPLFSSGEEFQETVVFDAPHAYLSRLLNGTHPQQHKNRVRVNAVLDRLSLLVQVYQVNLETYAKGGKPEWKHLVAITRDLETDPMYIFSYLRKQTEERKKSPYPGTIEDYIDLYWYVCHHMLNSAIRETMLDMKEDKEKDLGNIQRCVDLYTTFYHGGYEAHSILKPVDIVARAIINSPLEIPEDDLLWQLQGEVQNWLARVRNRQATGYAIFRGRDIDTNEEPAVRAFVTYFYEQVFKTYCQGERGILRSRLNRFKDGCEAYYVHLRIKQRIQEQEDIQIEEMQEAGV